MKTVYLSLGSNLGDREKHLQDALRRLETAGVRVVRVSSTWETEPHGAISAQPRFLNLVAQVETDLFPRQLLHRTQQIEREMGRARKGGQGPRTIDIDVLLFGPFIMHTPDLRIPHPRMCERRFVLAPLAELAPDLRHPETRQSIKELLGNLTGQQARRL